MSTDNALISILPLLQCLHCNRFLSEAYWLQRPCLHTVCSNCLQSSQRCPVCWVQATTVVNSQTMARVAALVAVHFPETRKPEYSVTLTPCTLPGLKSLLPETRPMVITGDLSVEDVGVRLTKELSLEGVKVEFGMCGELLTGGELLSELAGCFDNGEIVMECGTGK